jgi:hypothetical protein
MYVNFKVNVVFFFSLLLLGNLKIFDLNFM